MNSNASSSILAIGATGNVGSEVVRQLVAEGVSPRVYARDPNKARQMLGESGYELVEGDLGGDAVRAEGGAGFEWHD